MPRLKLESEQVVVGPVAAAAFLPIPSPRFRFSSTVVRISVTVGLC